MSGKDNEDPVKPWVSFDNYLIQPPEPVIEQESLTADDKARRFMISIAVVCVLTFALGAMTAMMLTAPRGDAPQIAAASQTVPDIADQPAVAPEVVQEIAAQKTAEAKPSLQDLVQVSLDEDVTRTQNVNLLTTTGPMSRIEPSGPTYAEILAGLTQTAAPATPSKSALAEISRDKLRMIREGVLGGAYSVKAIKRKGRERLCLRLENGDVSREEVELILQTAIENGEFEVPDALRQVGGEADVDTLLFNFVQTSLANDGTEEGAQAAKEMGRRAFAASKAKTTKDKKGRVYVVEPGDSLAYISLQFYGKPSDFKKIFEANRALLRSPDHIQVGQRLIIPS